MRNLLVIAAGVLLIVAGRAANAGAQATSGPARGCGEATAVQGFTIREARLNDPFWILRWRRPSAATLAGIEGLKGTPYTFAAANAVSQQIEADVSRANSTASGSVVIEYSDIGLVDCRDGQLDVVFTIVSASLSPTFSTLFEWRSPDKTANQVAGVEQTTAMWQFAPEAGFDAARRVSGGGRARAAWSGGHVPFSVLDARGVGSTEAHDVSVSLAGELDSNTGWLRRASWLIDYADSSTPTGITHVDQRSLGVQFVATSRPTGGVVTRFGGILDGGREQSGFAASQLPDQTVSNSDFTSARLFAGITGSGHQQTFAGSYALILGSTGAGFHGDWRKHIGDFSHDLWLPVGDHRLFEVEQRLTVGGLETIGRVPAAERFFGGAADQNLLLGDDWRIRATPVIRSIPTNSFSPVDAGAGGDRFVAYNSTLAFTVWGKPIVPKDLLNDDGFNQKLQAQLVSARSALDIAYQGDDANFRAIKDQMPAVVATLQRITGAETAARSAAALPPAAFDPCQDALQSAASAAGHAQADKPFQAVGWVKEMLPGGDNALDDVVTMCGVDLVAALKSAGAVTRDLEAAAADLPPLASTIATRFAAIDTTRSAQRAADDVGYAQRALDVITKQMNITSISPVFIFDLAHIDPAAADPHGGTRYAIGGGIRLSLASTVNLTATYAVNPHRGPGEGAGALVFSLTTRNLFE